jgi:hypothetical protein
LASRSRAGFPTQEARDKNLTDVSSTIAGRVSRREAICPSVKGCDMALDARRRQRKAERRASRQREKQRTIKRQAEKIAAKTLERIASAPILRCFMTGDRAQQGIPQVVISRLLSDGEVACSVFLLDVYCLGVKDAFLRVVTRDQFEHDVCDGFQSRFGTIELEAACARKLVEGAVEYARGLGFPPHADYAEAKGIFGDIDPQTCTKEFKYGKDGKPLFIPGPFDTPARCERIVRTLTEHSGPDGFKALLFSDEDELLPLDISFDAPDDGWDD